jgi:arylformamidase
MRKIYDITWSLTADIAAWPGDAEFSVQWLALQSRGDTVNLSGLTMSPHSGTHADAPFHCDSARPTIDQVPVDVYVGLARLVDVRGRSTIRVQDLVEHDWATTPRLLLRTGAWDDVRQFPAAIPVLAEDVPEFLHAQRMQLVGVDVPSVDDLGSQSLPLHRALSERGIHILEGLDLRLPPPGIYELIALPLKIQGGDGAPVRAILRERV